MISFFDVIGRIFAAGRFSVADLAYYQMVIQILMLFGFLIVLVTVIGMFIQISQTRQMLQKMCEAENIELTKPPITKSKD